MMIDRRNFIAGAAVVAVVPGLPVSQVPLREHATSLRYPAFMIEGWSAEAVNDAAGQVWITIDRSWRAAWR
jgi:hypothetical protein